MQQLTLAAIGCGHRTRTYVGLAAQQPSQVSAESHRIAFAAEESCLTGKTVQVEEV